MKLFTTLLISAVLTTPAFAQSMDDASALMGAGRYKEAVEMLDRLIASKPSAAGGLNLMAGECKLKLGEPEAAKTYLTKAAQRGVAEAHMLLGRMAMSHYDFADAKEQYAKYISLREKSGKDAAAGHKALADASAAADMLDRVEQLEFIDAVEVPLDRIFSAVVLSGESGTLFSDAHGQPGFLSSDGRLRYTTATDASGSRIYEQTRLLSGEYDAPQPIMDNQDASYPFMMPDGCTFYFASEREGGLGGLDIYRSNRDSEDGTFMGAVNMGMPYNSPANDYMLAIDEYTGVGWLISDRGHEDDGMATAYVFIPRETRTNYSPDTEGIVDFALIADIKATQRPDADYSAHLAAVDSLRDATPPAAPTHRFTMPDGRVVTRFSAAQLEVLADYQRALTDYNNACESLASLRRLYGEGNTELAPRILEAEGRIGPLRRTMREQKQLLIQALDE